MDALLGISFAEDNKSQTPNIIMKSLSIVAILGMTVAFGFIPYFCKGCRKSTKILGLANAFSGGIFMGIALFHLLPEAVENIEKHFEAHPDPFWSKVPIAFLLAFSAYALILFVEKVAFDSHALIDHDHGDEDGHAHGGDKPNKKDNPLLAKDEDPSSESDDEEEVVKNAISSKGKFASFLYMKNSGNSFANKSDFKPNKSLHRASMLLSKTLNNRSMQHHLKDIDNEDMNFMVNPENVHVDEGNNKDVAKLSPEEREKQLKKTIIGDHGGENVTSNFTAYLLLVALSLHGFFEGIALGIQPTEGNTLFLAAVILSHKWAEAFTLGISFTKANCEKVTFIKLICMFSMFTPAGIGLGMILSGLQSALLEGIVLAISTGTFIYVAASEVIVEEFAVTKYRFSKYILYLVGGIFVGAMAIFEGLGEE